MEDNNRANEAADEVGVAEPEQRRDDETESSDEDDSDEDNSDEEMEDSDSDDDDEEEEEEEEEWVPPTPEEVQLEFTYPQDFVGRSWEDVVQRRHYRLLIDPSCIKIPYERFVNCIYLIEIVFAENSCLTEIGELAFGSCLNLQRMNPFPDGLVELGHSAFRGCWSLEGRIIIPPSIQFVRKSCFAYCESITSVVFESSTATTTVLELEDEIFMYCKELRSVRLPNNLTVIPRECFCGCRSLIDVPIPGTVREVRTHALNGCSSLVSLDLPRNVTTIQNYAYAHCTSLKTVAIRSSSPNLQVGNGVFNDCPSLETMKVYPWIFPKLFHAVDASNLGIDDYQPNFMYKFYRKYEHQLALYRQQQQQQQRQL